MCLFQFTACSLLSREVGAGTRGRNVKGSLLSQEVYISSKLWHPYCRHFILQKFFSLIVSPQKEATCSNSLAKLC